MGFFFLIFGALTVVILSVLKIHDYRKRAVRVQAARTKMQRLIREATEAATRGYKMKMDILLSEMGDLRRTSGFTPEEIGGDDKTLAKIRGLHERKHFMPKLFPPLRHSPIVTTNLRKGGVRQESPDPLPPYSTAASLTPECVIVSVGEVVSVPPVRKVRRESTKIPNTIAEAFAPATEREIAELVDGWPLVN